LAAAPTVYDRNSKRRFSLVLLLKLAANSIIAAFADTNTPNKRRNILRFISGGPIIPDLLLGERDAGRVVFLCGAGVSIPSGMPTFVDLTQHVIDRLDPHSESEIRKAFSPWIDQKLGVPATARTTLDQVFNLLQLEYGRDQVGRLVSERLATDPKTTPSAEHEVISRISANQNGSPQIVTTNFDHLFEHALGSKSVRTYVPPTFPDLQHDDVDVTGITYLHGRLSEVSFAAHDYVLSSSDFGRAYLAQGWATSFIRKLLQRYTVVLLGYQAEDPPVKYLLQGLNSGRDHNKERLYAFEQGQAGEIEAKWQDRGVTPIAYPEHRALWDTLEAWAARSDNPVAWRSSIVDLARKGPKALESHERGMVAHLVRTAAGAKQFADAEPAISVEWLFVLDRTCRFSKPSKSFGEDAETFDPLEVYGLDDDPTRPPEGEPEGSQECEDLIAWRQGDDSLDHTQRLAGGTIPGYEPMPSRLFHLSRWMLRHVDQPALAWWVARQRRLNSRLHEILKRAIEDSDQITDDGRRVWMIICEALEDRDHDAMDMDWFQVRRRLKASGWTSSVIRAFEAATEPKFKIKRPYGVSAARPPTDDWSKVKWDEIAVIELYFPSQHGERPEVSDEALPSAFAALQRNLIRASERLAEAEQRWFRLGTLYPENPDGGDRHVMEQDSYVNWFLGLFGRMAISDPKLLRAHIDTWPDPERYIFDKLRLYAWNNSSLFSGDEVSERILALQDDQFWPSDYERELLFLLRDRWSDFSLDKKESISNRILNGRPKHDGEDEEKYSLRRSIDSAIVFGWLVKVGCGMPQPLEAKWSKLKEGLPEWRETWIDGTAGSHEPKFGWVGTNDDASVLDGVPVGQIINVAKENTRRPFTEFTEYKPFLGLVKNAPAKAISALGAAAKRDEYPADFWNMAISNWPDVAPTRATRLLHERMRRLPPEVIFEVRWAIGDWLRNQFPILAQANEAFAYSVFDDLVGKLLSNGPKATESSIGETWIGGEVVRRSRRTVDHAINSQIGKATEGLIAVLDSKKLQTKQGIPDDIKTRVERLLAAPREGSDHAVCLLARQISWLNYLDPSWVSHRMVPWFSLKHPSSEPAWDGILSNDWMQIQFVFAQIKADFLALPTAIRTWGWRDHSERKAYAWIVQASLLASDDRSQLTFNEVRDFLRQIDQNGLQHVIRFLGRVGAKNDRGWDRLVIPFIEGAWPRERRLQTEETSKAWVTMLNDAEETFPTVLNAVRGFLRPNRSSHLGLYRFHREIGEKEPLTVKFPKETLDLLDLIISDDPQSAPYDLSQVLNLLLETDPSIATDRRYERLRKLDASR
jgi:hypothetical protein